MKNGIRIICILLCSVLLFTACTNVSTTQPQETQQLESTQKPEGTQKPEDTQKPEGTQAPQQAEETQEETVELAGKPWTNSDICGNLPSAAPRLQDDFHMAVNYDWLSKVEIPEGEMSMSSFGELEVQRKEEIMALIKDDAINSHEAELVKMLYASTMDMDARNAQGAKPLMPYVEKIEAVQNLDELTELLTSGDYLIAEPFCALSVDVDDKNNSSYAVRIAPSALSLRDAGLYEELSEDSKQKKEINDKSYQQIFEKLGYSADEAKRMNEAAFAVETKLAAGMLGMNAQASENYREMIYNARTLDELREESTMFPIAQILEANGYGGSENYVLNEPQWLKTLNETYTEENLEGLKALLLYSLIGKTIKFMDQDFTDIYNEKVNAWYGASGEKPLSDTAYDNCTRYLAMAVGKIYVENYFTEDVKEDVESMIEQVRAVFKERLGAADWLTPQTRAKAIEKLDAIVIRVGYPDIWTDYSTLELLPVEQGGSLLENVISIYEFEDTLAKAKIGTQVQKGEWKECTPQEVNAFYNEKDNSINIPAGILGGVLYDKNGSQEQRLGAIGAIIGHEFTHAFDTLGGQYDKDGNLNNWWTDEDRTAFKERTDKVVAYYNGMEVLPGLCVNGELTIGEAVADIGGLACMMDIAKDVDDFDYKAFFEAYAQVWHKAATETFCAFVTQTDVHPLGYVRTNVTVQQFQQFYDAFGVVEGDNMYIAPENRLSVW